MNTPTTEITLKKTPVSLALIIAVVAMMVAPTHAEPAAEKLTPMKCDDMGISVVVTHATGAPLHKVTVKIPKDQEWFQEGVQIPRVVEGGFGTPFRLSVPVEARTDIRRDRVITFSMTREMLTETRLWVRKNGYIELKAFLHPVEAK